MIRPWSSVKIMRGSCYTCFMVFSVLGKFGETGTKHSKSWGIWKNKTCPKAFKNLFTLKPKNKYQLKRSCALLEPFCKSKFNQLCINYRGSHLWNTIVLSQNTAWNNSQYYWNFLKKNLSLIFYPLWCYIFILILCYTRR